MALICRWIVYAEAAANPPTMQAGNKTLLMYCMTENSLYCCLRMMSLIKCAQMQVTIMETNT